LSLPEKKLKEAPLSKTAYRLGGNTTRHKVKSGGLVRDLGQLCQWGGLRGLRALAGKERCNSTLRRDDPNPSRVTSWNQSPTGITSRAWREVKGLPYANAAEL